MEEIITIIKLSTLSVVIGFVIDLIVGDPHFLLHPVVLIGKFIAILEKIFRKILPKNKLGERWAGGFTAILTIIFSTIVPLAILYFAYKFNIYVYLFIESVMSWQILATKSLKTESMKVYKELQKGDIAAARVAVSMIVGRDTENLDEKQIVKAAVETVAENTSDGVIAPLIFLILGGAPFGFLYKAINTLDSMIGYKNEKYR
ncbi:MAG: adenosylcobinamide-phosphate synthase CbiB, partial [Clostridia bacterium]